VLFTFANQDEVYMKAYYADNINTFCNVIIHVYINSSRIYFGECCVWKKIPG